MIDAEPNLPAIAEWANDLDSGKYNQCTGALARDINGEVVSAGEDPAAHSYCCLGVAGLTARRLGYAGEILWVSGILNDGLRSFFGFESKDPALSREPCDMDDCKCSSCITWSATSLNDDRKLTFPEIAALVRTRYGIPQPEETAAQ